MNANPKKRARGMWTAAAHPWFIGLCLICCVNVLVGVGCTGGTEQPGPDPDNTNDNEDDGGGCNETAVSETDDAFFVAGAFGNDANFGGKSDPFATIQAAIDEAAESGGGEVYVAGGVYNQTISLRSNVNLHGGFDRTTWVQCPDSSPTTIVGGPTAMLAEGVESLSIDGFTIV